LPFSCNFHILSRLTDRWEFNQPMRGLKSSLPLRWIPRPMPNIDSCGIISCNKRGLISQHN
jgi:hypothetical protein